MQVHYWEEAVDYEVVVSKGFTELKPSAYTAAADDPPMDFRQSPADKSNMAKYLFGSFNRCLYPVQKFQSEAERLLAVIVDREAMKWFKPAKGQFQLFYRWIGGHLEYQPDFVGETADAIFMLEPKAQNQMNDPEVLAKKEAAVRWCGQASVYSQSYGGKPWKYALIPHTAIAENMTLGALVEQFGVD
jgi:type III restriction enzyme